MPFWRQELSLEEQMRVLYTAAELYKTNVPLAIKTLEKIPDMANEGFLQHDILDVANKLHDRDTNIRHEAATRLGQRAASGKVTQHPLIVRIYISVLHNDSDYGVRSGIAWSLGFMFSHGSKNSSTAHMQDIVVSSLLEALLNVPSPKVKADAAWALGKVKDKRILNELKQYLLYLETSPTNIEFRELYHIKGNVKDAIEIIEK